MLRSLLHVTLAISLAATTCVAQPSFRYFYDDSGQLIRTLDSTGALVEYIYDTNFNNTQINRSTVAPTALSILSLSPFNTLPGDKLVIYGQNFALTPAGNTVLINGLAATVVSASSTMLVVMISQGATSGQISVTVNGVTVTSGTLTLTVLRPPVITSIAPAFGAVGQTLTGVVITGTNLNNAQFDLQGGGSVTPVTGTSTQATVNIKAGQTPGQYGMVAYANNAISAPQPFGIYYPAGNNTVSLLFSVFNTAGPLSHIPSGSNEVDLLASVFNTAGSSLRIPAGKNEADLLFSTQNNSVFSGVRRAPVVSFARPGSDGSVALPAQQVQNSILAGQTIEVTVRPPVLTRLLQLDANGALLASTSNGALQTLFTAPFGVTTVDWTASGFTDAGKLPDARPQRIDIVSDPGRQIAGRLTADDGQPRPNTGIAWSAPGLSAEYFKFSQQLDAMPDLTALQPGRVGYVTAVNFPNPSGVFGQDPMGAEAGENFAARFRSKLQAATAGEYRFQLNAHANARVIVDGQIVAEVVLASGVSEVTGQIKLNTGAHDLAILYYQAAGIPALQLLWTPPDNVMDIVPPEVLSLEALAQSRVVTDDDGRFALTVPVALDGVQVTPVDGKGSISLEVGNAIQ